MRVLQINVVYDEKSTGRTCKELENFLDKKGIECITAYGKGEKNKGKNSYRIESKLEYYTHNILSQITGLEGYFSLFATLRLIHFIKRIKPDVIHLRNLHGHYLNLRCLFRFFKKTQIPLLFSLHDCWIFTGGCTYPVKHNCDKWKSECHSCPARSEYPYSKYFDFSKKIFKDKKKWLDGLNVKAVLGVSKWVASQGEKSILNKYPVSYIYNWINTDVFKDYNSKSVFEKYGIDKDKFTVICVAAAWKSGSVKNNDLEELAKKLGDNAQIVVVGLKAEEVKGENIIPIGFLSDISLLAQLYSASDVYVHLSEADTFGKVIAEAMACGIPAIAYDCTACSELIKENCGYLVPLHDVDALVDRVYKVKENKKEFYSENCKIRVKEEFDYNTNCERLLNIYINGELNNDTKRA